MVGGNIQEDIDNFLYTVGNLYIDRDDKHIYKLLKKEPCQASGRRSQCSHCEKLQLLFEGSGPHCQINSSFEPFFIEIQKSNMRW